MRRNDVGRGLVGRDVLGQFEMHRARPLLLRDPERVADQGRDALRGLTICVAILVSGRMVATMSTIWKRACRLLRIAFWPVIMTIGIAPRCA